MEKTFVIEPDKCTGCGICEVICSFTNLKNTVNPSQSRIRIIKKEELGVDLPVLCLHCRDPLCLDVCPMGAIKKSTEGLVKIDKDLCKGCKACMMVCPYGAIRVGKDEMIKCDLCGGDPMCIKWCPTGAIGYIKSDSSEIARSKKTIESLIKFVVESR